MTRGAWILLPLLAAACAGRDPDRTPARRLEVIRAQDPVQLASFDEVWRVIRDVYPDPTLKGLDWEQVYRDHLPLALSATSADALRPGLLAMLGTLGDSHCTILPGAAQAAGPGVAGVWGQDRPPTAEEMTGVGHLQGIFTRVEHGALAEGLYRIRLTAFMPAAMQPLTEAVQAALDAGARGLVLDLRGNPGGMALLAGTVAGHFLPPGQAPIARVVSREAELEIAVVPRPASRRYSGPMAVLVDGRSASTTEFFAAAMRSTGRARLFGQPTAGEALMATTHGLPNGDALYHPIALVYDAQGQLLEGAGVPPDEVVAPGGEGDPALDAAVCWLLAQSGAACGGNPGAPGP